MKIQEFMLTQMTNQLLTLVKQELTLDQIPDIELLGNEEATGGGTSFGQFMNDRIEVVTANRHPVDVMRTLAHELVHWKQRVSGMELNGEDGSETENQANAVAGQILRKFGRLYPEYYMNLISD